MSWIVSFVLAGLMISPESNLILNTNYNSTNNATIPQVVVPDENERFEQSYPFSANGKISVSNVNGSITVEAWDKNEIRLEAVKTASNKERLEEVEIRIDARQDFFSVETDYGNRRNGERGWYRGNNGNLTVEYRLNVPRGAVLDEIETVNGSVSISNMTNMVNASAVNGNVKAVNLRGTARISTVNGVTEADFDSLQGAGQISLETVNGRVNLTIPSDANATVKADTVNGNIVNDFGLPVRKGQYVGRDLYGKIGNGDVKIKLNSVNGELSVKRKNDGKNLSPAVNLLPQKSKDSDEWENCCNEVAKANKDISKASKDIAKANKEIQAAQKEAGKSVRDAQKEISLIMPEVAKITTEAVRESMKAVEVLNTAEMKEQLKRQSENLRRINIDWANSAPRAEKVEGNFNVKDKPTVTVDAKECSVSVKGWDKPEVRYFITKFARNADKINLKTEQKESDIKILLNEKDESEAYFPNVSNVRVEVFVPKKSNLRILTNREIRLENVSGDISLSGVDEAVNVRDVDGKLVVKAVDADVRVIGFKGEFLSETGDGTISLEGFFDKIDAKGVDGTVILTLPENSNADIFAEGEIESEGLTLIDNGEARKRIGKGGAKYNFNFADGTIILRNAKNLISEM